MYCGRPVKMGKPQARILVSTHFFRNSNIFGLLVRELDARANCSRLQWARDLRTFRLKTPVSATSLNQGSVE